MSRRSRKFKNIQNRQATIPSDKAARPRTFWGYVPFVFFFLAYLNVAVGSFFYPLDYDLGWHLKYGQDVVVNHFISSVNTYSVELPGYYWRNSSWLSDVLRYLIFTNFSFQGLMIAGIITMVLTFFFFAKASRMDHWSAALIFPFVTYLEIPLTSASFRAQLLSLAGMGPILWILWAYQHGKKKALWWIFPLYLLWSNLHGGFIMGTIVWIAWTILYIIHVSFIEKKLSLMQAIRQHGLPLGLALVGATLVSFINPWGIELYKDHLSFLNEGNPSQYLVEWKPLFQNSGLLTNHVIFGIIYFIALLTIIWKKRHLDLLPLSVITTLFYFASFFSRRFAWTDYLLAIPILTEAAKILTPKNAWASAGIAFIATAAFFLYAVNSLIPTRFWQTDWNLYCRLTGCSPASAEFIVKRHLENTKMYTTYDWGGWLIWNYPQIKPLVDGRMSTWVDAKGYNAFLHYIDYENNWKDIDQTDYDVVYLSPGKRALFNHMLELVDAKKWSVAYRDNYAFVFVRNANNSPSQPAK